MEPFTVGLFIFLLLFFIGVFWSMLHQIETAVKEENWFKLASNSVILLALCILIT